MTPEQLQAAFDKGYAEAMESTPQHLAVSPNRWEVAGLVEVARQQAEHDAQIADADFAVGTDYRRENYVRREVASAIRAQFANPSTTPKETR